MKLSKCFPFGGFPRGASVYAPGRVLDTRDLNSVVDFDAASPITLPTAGTVGAGKGDLLILRNKGFEDATVLRSSGVLVEGTAGDIVVPGGRVVVLLYFNNDTWTLWHPIAATQADLTAGTDKTRFVNSVTHKTYHAAGEADLAVAKTHALSAHAPSNAQKNSDITKAEIEAKLTGALTSHSHALTKAMVEAVLTGLITSHNHGTFLTEITKAMVESVLTGPISSHSHGNGFLFVPGTDVYKQYLPEMTKTLNNSPFNMPYGSPDTLASGSGQLGHCFRMEHFGTCLVSFEHKAYLAIPAVYRNGSLVANWSPPSTEYTTYTVEVPFAPGDAITVSSFTVSDMNASSWIKNIKLLVTRPS